MRHKSFAVFLTLASCTSTEGLDEEMVKDSDVTDAEVGDPPTEPIDLGASCVGEGTDSEWRHCHIDRRQDDLYDYPLRPPVGVVPWEEPHVNGAIGSLQGKGPSDGLVFTDFWVKGGFPTQNPGYLCAHDGQWGKCEDTLNLPRLSENRAMTAVAIDGDMMFLVSVPKFRDEEEALEAIGSIYQGSPSVELQFHMYRRLRADDGTVSWLDVSNNSLSPRSMSSSCAVTNVQLMNLTGDSRNEIVLGGFACSPIMFRWEGDVLMLDESLLPEMPVSNAGVFSGPVSADGDRFLISLAFDGQEMGLGYNGTTCWYGSEGAWIERDCPPMIVSGDPMGMTWHDLKRTGNLDFASSDVAADRSCTASSWSEGDLIACFEERLPYSGLTLKGGDAFSVSWSVAAVGDRLVFVRGYEHALVRGVHWEDWPQQIGVWTWEEGAWSRERGKEIDRDVQERGLLVADLNLDGCLDLLPLPVGFTDMRALVAPCQKNSQVIAIRYRGSGDGGYGTEGIAVYADGSRKSFMVTGTFGYAGHSPPLVEIDDEVENVVLRWPTGDVTIYNRGEDGNFPDTIFGP